MLTCKMTSCFMIFIIVPMYNIMLDSIFMDATYTLDCTGVHPWALNAHEPWQSNIIVATMCPQNLIIFHITWFNVWSEDFRYFFS